MATSRKFSRFNRESSSGAVSQTDQSDDLATKEIPSGGLCLSVFLVISEEGRPNIVLMGILNPDAAWDHIGALDKSRMEAYKNGWMLPSSHLMIHEPPLEAAKRVASEQLGLQDITLSEPKVVSEVYQPKRAGAPNDHWDIEFIFKSSLPGSRLPEHKAWNRLEFVDLNKTKKEEIARSHEDILESAGFRLGG